MSFSETYNRGDNFPSRHVTITPSDAADLVEPMLIYCGSDGNIAVEDKYGTAVTYAVTAGTVLPVLVAKVLSTGTTVTQVIGLR